MVPKFYTPSSSMHAHIFPKKEYYRLRPPPKLTVREDLFSTSGHAQEREEAERERKE